VSRAHEENGAAPLAPAVSAESEQPSHASVMFVNRERLAGVRVLLFRLTLGGIFVYAGVRKNSDPWQFADSLASFALLPTFALNPIALFLPPFEILLGVLLLSGRKPRAAALAATLLGGIFVVMLTQGILRGLPLDCGCFGTGDPSAWTPAFSLARALLVFLMAFSLWWRAAGFSARRPNAPRLTFSSAPRSRAPCRNVPR
jgi:putative oxidoreductase